MNNDFDSKIEAIKDFSFTDKVTWLQDKGFITQKEQEQAIGLPGYARQSFVITKLKIRFDKIFKLFF